MTDAIDILIVGGGPAGTAAAFRATELGRSVRLIDRDEVLSILKDWVSPDGDAAKDKVVDASYGPGGRQVPFPAGGELVSRLVFEDRTPASVLYNRWRSAFTEHSIDVQSGVELVGLEPQGDLLEARCVRPATRDKPTFKVRSVVLAMGRGVPTKLEIPGDTTGINYKLREVERYCGRPACIVGGGTSAAEAVIAISNAKAEANDPSDVFWAYRRRNLPKVNSTLAEAFFAAFSGNGNIRYLPFSEPLAVLKGPGDTEFVALRADRRELSARPTEGTYLEFAKEQVLACIGADLPVEFLFSLGIPMLRSADDDESYMAIAPWLESQVRNVFMIGDLLSPAFIQTRDFAPEAEQSTVLDHIGNFKRGMLDGVLAVEAIHARLGGTGDDALQELVATKSAEYKAAHSAQVKSAAKAAPPPAPAPELPPPQQVGARFVRMSGAEREEVGRDHLVPGRYVIGRTSGQLTFPGDDRLVDNHALILVEPDACYVSTEGTDGSCMVGVAVERTIAAGDVILAGQQRLRVELFEGKLALAVLDADDQVASWLPVADDGRSYGRQRSTRGIAIDPRDKSLSRRHFFVQSAGTVLKLRDYGSMNGTYLEVHGSLRLNEGDQIYVGSQCLRFDGMKTGTEERERAATAVGLKVEETLVGRPEETMAGTPAPQPAAAPAPAAAAAAPAAEPTPAPAADGPPSIAVQPIGQTLELTPEQTILDKLIEAKLATKKPAEIGGNVQMLYDCKGGTCGKCLITIDAGEQHVSKLSGKEKRTLKLIVPELNDQGRDLAPDKCHLACRATVTGPVAISLLGDTETA